MNDMAAKTAPDTGGDAVKRTRPQVITIEEAFITRTVADALTRKLAGTPEGVGLGSHYLPLLLDIGADRIAGMDAAGIDMQVLSLTAPGINGLDAADANAIAISVNDELHSAVNAYPERLAALAAIAPQTPQDLARELQRAVTKLGMKGAIINSSADGVYLDDPRHDAIWEAAQDLDVPIYIHPRFPSPDLRAGLAPGFAISWGFAIEAGTNVIRMMSSGVFDRFPKLKIILGHLGENLPFIIDRMDNRYAWEVARIGITPVERKPSDYLRSNIYYTTSGMHYPSPIRATIEVVGIDRVMFAADHPYEDQKEAVDAVTAMDMDPDEKSALLAGNAIRILKL